MRLRIIDLNTPWFWFTFFYQQKYGEPYLTASFWKPHTWKRFWLHIWKWENVAVPMPMEAFAVAIDKETSNADV